ncbi:hypothetical protein HMPREF9080_01814 [Cardiobacterium valvarum F0432]|uniref:Uncharacterized protein n=1 Tax=Cardiobacterium valvarum F0432 TaxID=797473 RepID=G9ZGB2_9GAMM|nr:hypothetical protein HMPREF9080_01814 [Cardiobacterium valvarum F0432]
MRSSWGCPCCPVWRDAQQGKVLTATADNPFPRLRKPGKVARRAGREEQLSAHCQM